ncbi:unnamed protein product [Owenia fusiformis]|uniref:Uncharacterized protein n=1 Tax=Owenia fusiformis TaxID=6347 RepID=A0A8S4PSI2_OWEFU|nr:unnamed protein product [Owenia fusiformis]
MIPVKLTPGNMAKVKMKLSIAGIILLGLLDTVCSQSQSFGTLIELNDDQQEKCAVQANFIEDPANCCGFIRCINGFSGPPLNINGVYGIRMDCPSSSIWHPERCMCVDVNLYDFACPADTCTIREIDGYCGEFLGDDECCLEQIDIRGHSPFDNAQTYKQINDTHYEFKGTIQGCPKGQLFYLDVCCCEGVPEVPPQQCLHYSFDERNIVNNRGIRAMGVHTLPGQEGVFGDGIGFQRDSSLKIDEYTWINSYTFFACLWVKFSEEMEPGIIFHNGEDGGYGATVMLELVVAGNGDRLLVGGVSACDRVEDLVLFINPDDYAGVWKHLCLSLNETGFVSLTINGFANAILERDRLEEFDLVELMLIQIDDARFLANEDWMNADIQEFVGIADIILDDISSFVGNLLGFWIETYDVLLIRIIDWILHKGKRDDLQSILEQLSGDFQEIRPFTTEIMNDLSDIEKEIKNIARTLDLSTEQELLLNAFVKKVKRIRYMFELVDPILVDADTDGRSYSPVTDTLEIGLDLVAFWDYVLSIRANGKKRREIGDIPSINAEDLKILLKTRPKEEWFKYVFEMGEVDVDLKRFLKQNSGQHSRTKRNNIPIPGDPVLLRILGSKQPLRLGEGFVGVIDEFVLCDFIPDMEELQNLYENNIIPEQPLGEWHV